MLADLLVARAIGLDAREVGERVTHLVQRAHRHDGIGLPGSPMNSEFSCFSLVS